MKRRLFIAGIGLIVAGVAGYTLWPNTVSVGAAPIFTGETDGIAINGYDPVAYFEDKKPVKGLAEHSHKWRGVDWLFASAKNKAAFASEPEKYTPQYGGYCAYAAANNSIAKTEPDAWAVVDGKLYLNFDQNVQSLWDKDRPGYIEAADENWPELSPK